MELDIAVVRRSQITRMLVISTVLIALTAGCSSDSPMTSSKSQTQGNSGIVRGSVDPNGVAFEFISATNGDPNHPITGPFAVRGRNIHYDSGALIIDLSVANLGETSFAEPITLTFLSLLPDSVTISNSDNDQSGAGAQIVFAFADSDLVWSPDEESEARPTNFVVAQGTSVGFIAQLDAGNPEGGLGSIGGMVFNDADGDGVMDMGEGGLEGATLKLEAEGMEDVTALSTSDGTYSFDGLAVGFYTLRKMEADSMMVTTGNPIYVTLVEGEDGVSSFLAANFGCKRVGAESGSVTGLVFNDANQNGTKDESETGLMDIEVRLEGPNGLSSAGMTDDAGAYSFLTHDAGSYLVWLPAVTGFVSTTPDSVTVELEENGDGTADFGLRSSDVEFGSVSGTVFNDANQNGTQDTSEMGLEGIEVRLAGPNGLSANASTDVSGGYSLITSEPGEYLVWLPPVTGFTSTTPDSVTLELEANGDGTANFGLVADDGGGNNEADTISGTVFNDKNHNHKLDEGEDGIEGVEVRLSKWGEKHGRAHHSSRAKKSDADGAYSFSDLRAGFYVLSSEKPRNFHRTTPKALIVVLKSNSSCSNANFGFNTKCHDGCDDDCDDDANGQRNDSALDTDALQRQLASGH